MASTSSRGKVYRCPVCKAEVTVVGTAMGLFLPHCCNVEMIELPARVRFYVCPVCGAEIALLRGGTEPLTPRCCNTAMLLEAA